MISANLHTERLQLIPLNQGDTELFYGINTSPFVRQFLWDDEMISMELALELMQKNEEHFTQSQFGLWKISARDEQTVMGYTGLWYFFDEAQPQLIYALLEPHAGQGYATEAAQRIIDYTFDQLRFTYLIAAMDKAHLASQQVAQRLGMRFVEERIEEGKPTVFYRIDKAQK